MGTDRHATVASRLVERGASAKGLSQLCGAELPPPLAHPILNALDKYSCVQQAVLELE